MKSNLNVYAIQNNPEELKKALEQLKKGFNYVYSNCMFSIQLGKQELKQDNLIHFYTIKKVIH